MDFRVRPSSKKSQTSQRSLVELPPVRSFQQTNNSSQLRSLAIRIQNVQNNFINHQDIWRRERDIVSASYLQMQKRMDMLEYRTFSNEKDVKQMVQRDFGNSNNNSNKNQIQMENIKQYSQSEINILKQALAQQRQTHREYAKHQGETYAQIARRQMKLESEMRELLNKQRDDYDGRLNQQIQEIKNTDSIKQKKIDNQYELMKTVIQNSEKKIFAQFQRKLRSQNGAKDFIQDKIEQLREQMTAEQRNMMAKQSKFVREIKQSIESILLIIKNTQKQLTEQLSQTQKQAASNIKKLSTTIELLKQKHDLDYSNLSAQQVNLQNQMTDVKGFVNNRMQQNRQIMMQIEQQNQQRASRMSKGSKIVNQDGVIEEGESPGKIDKWQKQFNNWKTVTEQKNLNVFKEISNTLKAMKLQWKKQNDQVFSQIGSFKQSLSNVKKSVPLEIKKSVQAIVAIFNNQFDTLAQELDSITDMIALSKKQVEKQLRSEIKKSSQQTINQVKQLIKNSSKQSTLNFQKSLTKQQQSLKVYVEQETKFVKDLLIQKNSNLEVELNQVSQANKKNVLNTTAQLQDFTLKLKTFNENFKDHIEEQRKDDLKKRIQLEDTMRKNANTLIDLYYKKCEFLVDGMKKAIEMNMLKDISTVKRDIQQVKQAQNKITLDLKQSIYQQMNTKMDKMVKQRESAQQIMHQAIDMQINTVRKNLQISIGNTKLQVAQKINQVVQIVNQLHERAANGPNQDFQNIVQSLKETVWKIQAMSFSQQAKNKAIMDRMGQDITQLSLNLVMLSNQLNSH